MLQVSGAQELASFAHPAIRSASHSFREVIMYRTLSPSPITNATYVFVGSYVTSWGGTGGSSFASRMGDRRVEKKDRLPVSVAMAPMFRESRHRVCAS